MAYVRPGTVNLKDCLREIEAWADLPPQYRTPEATGSGGSVLSPASPFSSVAFIFLPLNPFGRCVRKTDRLQEGKLIVIGKTDLLSGPLSQEGSGVVHFVPLPAIYPSVGISPIEINGNCS